MDTRDVQATHQEIVEKNEDNMPAPKHEDENIARVVTAASTLKRKHLSRKRKRVRKTYAIGKRPVLQSKRPRQFSCLFCGKKFCLKTSLEKHIRWDHITEIHSTCSSCGENITTTCPNINLNVGDINNHIVKRSDSKCSSVVTQSDRLRNDGGLNKNRTILCESCKYSMFSDTDSQSDTDVKKQAETISSSTEEEDKEKTNNSQHDNTAGSKTRTIASDLCEKMFPPSNKKDMHIQTKYYGELFECKDCRKSFTVEANYRQHMFEIHSQKGVNI